jgi:hypothetical protein
MRAIFWIENSSPMAIEQRAGVQGSIGGLEDHGLFIDPSPFEVAKSLAAHLETVRQVLIAHHPATPQERATLRADMPLPEFARERKKEILEALEKLNRSHNAYSATLERLRQEREEIAFVAKCLRQDPSDKVAGSHLFDRLVEIAKARHVESELEKALQALEKEFAVDRGALLLTWQRITGKLCALDLDLNALAVLSRKDYGLGGSQAAEYLREMLSGAKTELASLGESLQQEMKEVERLWGGDGAPDLKPISELLAALARVAAASPSGVSPKDVADLIGLATGPQGFGQALWKLSQYFSVLVQQTGAAVP